MIIATCPTANYNPTSGECSQVVFVEQEGLLPSLSIQDASALGSLIVGCWALGFAFKLVRKHLFR